MRHIDEPYTRTPFYGSRRMVAVLRSQGWRVNRKRVQRLMQQMGLEAIYPKPRLSGNDPQHRIYAYLLRGVVVDHPDQVWGADITYIRLQGGFWYLVAILDWFRRYVLAWRLSNTLDVAFCVEALEEALSGGRRPGIFNSDQGVQFTSQDFTGRLEREGIRIRRDGRGRVFDNIFVERLWRSVKIRGGLPQGLRGRRGGPAGVGEIFPALQPGTSAPGAGVPDARGALLRGGRAGCEGGAGGEAIPAGGLKRVPRFFAGIEQSFSLPQDPPQKQLYDDDILVLKMGSTSPLWTDPFPQDRRLANDCPSRCGQQGGVEE